MWLYYQTINSEWIHKDLAFVRCEYRYAKDILHYVNTSKQYIITLTHVIVKDVVYTSEQQSIQWSPKIISALREYKHMIWDMQKAYYITFKKASNWIDCPYKHVIPKDVVYTSEQQSIHWSPKIISVPREYKHMMRDTQKKHITLRSQKRAIESIVLTNTWYQKMMSTQVNNKVSVDCQR